MSPFHDIFFVNFGTPTYVITMRVEQPSSTATTSNNKRQPQQETMTTMKRSAEEAFIIGGSSGSATGNLSMRSTSRVSIVSSSSSSTSSLLLDSLAARTFDKRPFHEPATKRGSSNISVTDDNDAPVIHDTGIGGSIIVTTRLRNARILQRDGTLKRGSIDLSNGIITDVSIATAHSEEEVEDEESNSYSNDDNEIVQVIDCQNHILSPGYIDIQINGAIGIDFSNDGNNNESHKSDSTSNQTSSTTTWGELNEHGILRVAQHLVRYGVTSFCPTMVSSSPQTYRRIIPMIRNARNVQQKELLLLQQCQHTTNNVTSKRGVGANILGMHLEGPFFARTKHGAHELNHIRAPIHGISTVKEVYGFNNDNTVEYDNKDDTPPSLEDVDIITLAPELPGAFDAILSLTGSNNSLTSTSSSTIEATETHSHRPHSIIVSCGHTNATYDEGIHALMSGANLITHLFNAMNPFHHRSPGLVGLLSSSATKLGQLGLTKPYYSMIVDGIHVHESAVSMAYQCHPHGCVLVTDAMAAMGLGDGLHSLGNMKVCTKGDYATVAGTDTLAGSVVSMDTCVKRFLQFTACTIGEALLCATLHPATVLKRHITSRRGGGRSNNVKGSTIFDAPIGVLEVGARADIILLNEGLDVLATWVGGQIAFRKGKDLSSGR